MTVAETIIGGFLLAIFTGMLGLLIGGKKKVSTEEYEKHLCDPTPHKNCLVHSSELSDMKRILNRIDNRIYRLMGGQASDDE